MANRGRLHWFDTEIQLYVSLRENDPTSQLIDYIGKQFPHRFTASVATFTSRCSFLNDGPIDSKIDHEAGYSSGLVNKSPSCPKMVTSGSKKANMATVIMMGDVMVVSYLHESKCAAVSFCNNEIAADSMRRK